jgi:hypothetical protein
MKLYDIQTNIGKCKYVVTWHDGTFHKDGSPFHAIKIFKNKKKMAAWLTEKFNS